MLPEEDDNYSHLIMIPVEDNQVEETLSKLKGLGSDREGYLVVSEVEAVVSDKIDFQREKAEKTGKKTEGRIAREELVSSARSLSRNSTNFALYTILSAVVATAGLLMNSASVVVGSMVIAPLIGPAMASSVGSVIKDDKLFTEGVKTQLTGLFTAILCSTIFAILMRSITAPQLDLMLLQQVAERVHSGLLSLSVALAAGVAGALSLTSGASAALVGVMIAVALIPPAATVGLGIAYLQPVIAFSSLTLVIVNLLSINLMALLTLWAKGYRPEKYYKKNQARGSTIKRGSFLIVMILILASFLSITTAQERQENILKQNLIEQTEQAGLNLIDYQASYEIDWLFRKTSEITLVIEQYEEGQLKFLKQYLRQSHPDLAVRIMVQPVKRIR